MKVEIYDPPMCCPTGLCGPAVDPALMKISDAILALKKQGVSVERYNLKSDYMTIKDNTLVMAVIHRGGSKMMPITVIKGKIFKTGEYPSYEEICKELEIEPLKSNKPISIQVG
ncbi:MAG TPA: arsenite efflux transporter metallochaperone ArsD [Spirochaetota bacterium]|nr:arsenite efflux transporter metallochaperone ArsD [Spirochaetota bacterium]HPC43408.1 arsenite efflux transporter metallochaperone ArsD [Spirochaetota bacterium]HQF10589.1 arsenite efflux transporter metallochaperone ArsD [Spirochaetota bacterium]HQH99559.1 arsenite efflux transporter metallochaperone ArsD [Spirochaetota bacterium]HRS79560.1 arsenite efflux transporter metallochaperone ArsD [Spirochaetota bacterium]